MGLFLGLLGVGLFLLDRWRSGLHRSLWIDLNNKNKTCLTARQHNHIVVL